MFDPSTQQPPGEVAGFEEYSKHYNETDFWKKFKTLPRAAAAQVLEQAFILRELIHDPRTPMWVRGIIVGALGYFILPIDLVPDPIPGAGYIDDLSALILVLAYIDYLVTSDIRERVKKRMPDVICKSNGRPTSP